MSSAELIRELEQAGFTLARVRDSHHAYRHQDGRVTVVPHPRKDLGKGLVSKIRKQAGLK